MGRGSGFGKTILFNEHFVVHGVPGIVSAIHSAADAEVKQDGKGITVEDSRKSVKGYAEAGPEKYFFQNLVGWEPPRV
jgi:mevalonate kinase